MKHPIPSRAIDAFIGDEEQNGKQKRTKERNREWSPTQLPWTIQSPPTTRRDPTISLLFSNPCPQGSMLLKTRCRVKNIITTDPYKRYTHWNWFSVRSQQMSFISSRMINSTICCKFEKVSSYKLHTAPSMI